MLVQRKVGRHLYVFHQNGHRPGANSQCAISAHGCQNGRTFRVPAGVTINFYGNHGRFLVAQTEKMIRGAYRPVETLVAGQACHDYSLQKYDGYSYDDYRTRAHPLDVVGFMSSLNYGIHNAPTAAELNGIGNSQMVMDIVTIRNRDVVLRGITLSGVINDLRGPWWRYTTINCNFCRVTSAYAAMPTHQQVPHRDHAQTLPGRF